MLLLLLFNDQVWSSVMCVPLILSHFPTKALVQRRCEYATPASTPFPGIWPRSTAHCSNHKKHTHAKHHMLFTCCFFLFLSFLPSFLPLLMATVKTKIKQTGSIKIMIIHNKLFCSCCCHMFVAQITTLQLPHQTKNFRKIQRVKIQSKINLINSKCDLERSRNFQEWCRQNLLFAFSVNLGTDWEEETISLSLFHSVFLAPVRTRTIMTKITLFLVCCFFFVCASIISASKIESKVKPNAEQHRVQEVAGLGPDNVTQHSGSFFHCLFILLSFAPNILTVTLPPKGYITINGTYANGSHLFFCTFRPFNHYLIIKHPFGFSHQDNCLNPHRDVRISL